MPADHTVPITSPITSDSDACTSLTRPYSRVTVWAVIALAGLIIGLWLVGTPPGILGKADAVGYAICHRIEARTFTFNGRPLPLCARCMGIYLGVMTGLTVFVTSGRIRASRLPNIKILVILLLFGAAVAVDGLNSYFSLFPAYPPIYRPNNTMRLSTGMYAGLTMISVVLPVFNMIVWRVPYPIAPLQSLKEIAALSLLAALVIAAVLVKLPALLLVLGLVSTAGVVLMFGVVGCVMFLTVTQRENSATCWRDLALPALAGLTFAISVIGAINVLRYAVTGTWDGFNLPGQ